MPATPAYPRLKIGGLGEHDSAHFALRPLRPHLLVGNLYRRSRHLLAVINES